MKLITFVVPSYNSQDYLHTAVESLLVIKDDCEIIIVNDGSTDKTLEIATRYQKFYPNTVKVIDKPNGGHGSGVNAGLKNATGLYFKVVDSDDWLDKSSLLKFVEQLKIHHHNQTNIDLYITNFVYEHVEDNTQFVRDYSENFKENVVFNWDKLKKKFKYSKTLLMHALVFRTALLREIGLELPEHTFYVDNIVAYLPLPFVKNVFYMNIPLYRYFIGRSDQSVTLNNISKRYKQQIKVYEIIYSAYSYSQISKLPKGLRSYIKHYLSSIMIITQMFTISGKEKERKQDLKQLWKKIKKDDLRLYRFLRYRSNNTFVNFLPWRIRQFVMIKGYLYLAKKVKLG